MVECRHLQMLRHPPKCQSQKQSSRWSKGHQNRKIMQTNRNKQIIKQTQHQQARVQINTGCENMPYIEHHRSRDPTRLEGIAIAAVMAVGAAVWLNSCGPGINDERSQAQIASTPAAQPVARLYQPPSSNPARSTTPYVMR